MCGVVGSAGPGGSLSLVESMAASLVHRGPDGAGFWRSDDGAVHFGHRRLSIIDLSEAGDQPMSFGGGRYTITYNGELYNYREIRDELRSLGVAFHSESDTEVMLAACAQWGVEAALQRGRGMWGLGLYDRSERCLWLARDRFGEKPLYYAVRGESLYFASELKALRVVPDFDPTIDRVALGDYMRFGAMRGPATIYRAARQVVPGTALRFRIGQHGVEGPPRCVTYFDAFTSAAAASREPFGGTFDEAVTATEEVLTESVRQQMVSDVPLGAFLSGGIDSSTIVALMQAAGHDSVKTFTIGFDEAYMSEAAEARAVATHLGTDHTELVVQAQDALDVVPGLARMYDEPFADSSQIPTYLVSRLARGSVTVALSGDAGDEFFSGYNRYILAGQLWQGAERVPMPARKLASRAIRAVSPHRFDQLGRVANGIGIARGVKGGFGDRAHKLAGLLDAPTPGRLYESMITHWADGIVVGSSVRDAEPPTPEGMSFTEQMMLWDTVGYLPQDILTKVDRAAMAVSLETRVPFLSEDVYLHAWHLPLEYKVRPGVGKLVLREVLARHVPRELFERPKMGFGIPLDSWLRGPLREWAGDLLSPDRLRAQGLLDEAAITRRWNEHLSGRRNWQYSLWTVLMFQAWLDEWMTAAPSISEPTGTRGISRDA